VRVELELDPALAMGPRVTAVIPVRRPGPERRYVAAGASFERLLGAAYWRRPYFYWSDGSYDGPTILGRAVKIDDAPATAARRPSPPTDEDRLAAAIEARAYAAAADLILESAGPFEPEVGSWRTLVACLEAAGRTGEAARVFVERLEKARDARELAELGDLSLELAHVLEAVVLACEADVGDLVDVAEAGGDALADLDALDLAVEGAVDVLVDLLGELALDGVGDRAFAEGDLDGAEELLAVEGDAGAVALDDDEAGGGVDALVGGEAAGAGVALAASADGAPALGGP